MVRLRETLVDNSPMSSAIRSYFAAVACVMLPAMLLADAAAQQAPVPDAAKPTSMAPFVDAAHALGGAALVRELRSGGYLLYMRHAFAGAPKEACPGEAALTEEGQSQARQVGLALRTLRIPVARVEASQTCRTQDTARLLDVGPVTDNPDLNPASLRAPVTDYAEQFRYLLRRPPKNSNWMMVSHVQGFPDPLDRILIGLAEVVVYRFDGGSRALPVARIPLQAWPTLISDAASAPGN